MALYRIARVFNFGNEYHLIDVKTGCDIKAFLIYQDELNNGIMELIQFAQELGYIIVK